MKVLDATCSAKRRWPEVADVRVDISPAAHPDVVADDRSLPFADETFDWVFCDPPHLVKSWKNKSALVNDETYMGTHGGLRKVIEGYRRFSIWGSMKDFFDYLDEVNPEFARVLQPAGMLCFKSTDGTRAHGTTICYKDVIARLDRFRLVKNETVESQGYFAKWHKKHHGTLTLTHYLTFQKV